MKRAPWFLALVVIPATVHAHVGSPDVYFEGAAGPYRVLVTVRPPTAVPGIDLGGEAGVEIGEAPERPEQIGMADALAVEELRHIVDLGPGLGAGRAHDLLHLGDDLREVAGGQRGSVHVDELDVRPQGGGQGLHLVAQDRAAAVVAVQAQYAQVRHAVTTPRRRRGRTW